MSGNQRDATPPGPLMSNKALRIRVVVYLALLVGAGAFWFYAAEPLDLTVGGGHPETWGLRRLRQQVYSSVSADEEAGFTRLDPKELGGWLATVPEQAQSVETYEAESSVRPVPGRQTIVLQPLGGFSAERMALVQATSEFVAAFYQVPVRLEKPLPLEITGRALDLWTRQVGHIQYDASAINYGILQPTLPADESDTAGQLDAERRSLASVGLERDLSAQALLGQQADGIRAHALADALLRTLKDGWAGLGCNETGIVDLKEHAGRKRLQPERHGVAVLRRLEGIPDQVPEHSPQDDHVAAK
jgi:hypothetical protein